MSARALASLDRRGVAITSLAGAAPARGRQRRHRRRRRQHATRQGLRACSSPRSSRSTTRGISRAPTATSSLRHGEEITDVSVSEDGRRYEPGGDTTLGSFDRPNRYGAERIGSGARIVWHYRATDELRTFELSLPGAPAAVAYDDVLDLGWTVWGDQWDFELDQLTASVTDPALDPDDQSYRVWGHPAKRRGRDSARRRHRNAGGVGHKQQHRGRDAGDDPAQPGPDDQRARARSPATASRRSSPRRRSSTRATTRSSTGPSAGSQTTPCCCPLCSRRSPHSAWRSSAFFARERPASAPEVPRPSLPTMPGPRSPTRSPTRAATATTRSSQRCSISSIAASTKPATTTTEKEKLDLTLTAADDRPATDALAEHEREVLCLLRSTARRPDCGDERDEGQDPRSLRALARALGGR